MDENNKKPCTEPDPALQLEPKHQAQEERVANRAKILLLAAATCSLAAYSLLFDHKDTLSADSRTMDTMIDDRGDNVNADIKAKIDSQFMIYTAKLTPIDFSDEKIKADFIEEPFLQPEVKQEILADTESGKRRVSAITLWDNFDQDGDVVRIEAGGVVMDIPILHAPTTVFVPFVPGEPLLIQGVFDGGGGITAAIETMSGPVPLPIMAVGQTIVLPLL